MATLDPLRTALVRTSAAIAARDDGALDLALRSAIEVLPPESIAVDEAILQSHLFVGFPIALEAHARWRAVCGRAAPEHTGEEPRTWAERGPSVCRRVYGKNYERLRANVREVHPDLDALMVDGGYGRVLGRAGLDLATRELCIAALLAVWDTPRQLHSHLRGALNAGALAAEVREAIEIAIEYAEPDAAGRSLDLLNRIIP